MTRCLRLPAIVILLSVLVCAGFHSGTSAQLQKRATNANAVEPVDGGQSELRPIIELYAVNRGSLQRSYQVSISTARRDRFRKFYLDELAGLQRLDFDSLSQEGKVDYVLFRNHLEHELRQLDIEEKQLREVQPLVPFSQTIIDLEETRRRMESMDSARTASLLNNLKKQIDDARQRIEPSFPGERRGAAEATASSAKIKKTVAYRAVAVLNNLRNSLRNWYTFYNGYDPIFTWWNEEPYKAIDQSLSGYASFLAERVVGIRAEPAQAGAPANVNRAAVNPPTPQRAGLATPRAGDTSDIVGDPIGREALLSELQSEMVPYPPEELIAIANKEMAWCENEMKKAARELGYGDDWKKALEQVKNLYVEPGKQPQMIRDLALEAIKFVDDHDLVTVPQLARDTWRMEMMTPERQLVSPFFLGGEVILVSFPTNTMSHEQKMMSMRGNNIHFARATVFHELIPGHH